LTEYDSVKISRIVKSDLDKIRIEMGLPSSSQTITALIRLHKTKQEIISEIKKDLAEESSKIITTQFYRKIFEIFSHVDKHPSQITLADLMDKIIKKIKS
jgi:hypothetical protein